LKDAALEANAANYWLEQELYAGTVDLDEARKIIARLDDFYIRKENGSGKFPAWPIRKNILTQLVNENAKRVAAREAVETLKAELPLLIN